MSQLSIKLKCSIYLEIFWSFSLYTIISMDEVQPKWPLHSRFRFSKSGRGIRDKRFLALVQKQLHKVLFLINVAFEDDIEAEKDLTLVRTSFTEKAEAMNMLHLLRNLDYPSKLICKF